MNDNHNNSTKPSNDKIESPSDSAILRNDLANITETNIQNIVNDYGYTGRRTWFAISCLFFTFLTQGMAFTFYSLFLIPLTNYFSFTTLTTQLIASLFFVTVGIGSFISGILSAKYSRPLLTKVLFGLLILMNFLMGVVKNIYVFSIARFSIGFLLGILTPIEYSICSEYLPTNLRAFALASIGIGYAFGRLFNSLMMKFMMPNLEAEYIPMCIFLMLVPLGISFLFNLIFVEDSPRNLLKNDKNKENVEKGFEILNDMKIHSSNGSQTPLTAEEKEIILSKLSSNLKNNCQEDSYLNLVNQKNRRLTILLLLIHAFNSMNGTGFLLVYTLIIKELHKNEAGINSEIIKDLEILSFFALVSPFVTGLFCEIKYLGRIKTMVLANLIAVVAIFNSALNSKFIALWVALCITFQGISSTTSTLYGAEAYNTLLRNRGVGVLLTAARVGGFLSQFIFIEMFNAYLFAPVYFVGVSNFFVATFAFFLPFETLGVNLDETQLEIDQSMIKGENLPKSDFCKDIGKIDEKDSDNEFAKLL